MKTKLFTLFAIVTLLFAAAVINQAVAQNSTNCDPTYVTQSDNDITVEPTGIDDTVNIQCAFDTAVVNGPGIDVHLTSGTFHTAQIVVTGYEGDFVGDGAKKTKIVNLPNLYVTPVNMYFQPPSDVNPWPTLFAFIDGDFGIADLAIRIVGEEPTTGWTIFGIDPPLKEMAGAIYIMGTEAYVLIEDVVIEGEAVDNPESWFGYNLINGTFFEGFIGESPPPISGSFEVYDSRFSNISSGTPVANLFAADVTISRNKFADVGYATDGGDFVDSTITFSNNKVSASTGLDFYNIFNAEDVNATLIIMENKFSGDMGPMLNSTFGDGNKCLFLNNKTHSVTGTGIYLGAGTNDCFVVADKTDIVDLGTDNVVIGQGNTISYEE